MIKNKVHDRYGTVLRRGEAAVLCSLDFPEKGEINRICDKNKVVTRIKITCFLNFIYILVHILKYPVRSDTSTLLPYPADVMGLFITALVGLPLSCSGRSAAT